MTTPPQLRDASPVVIWSREGSTWRIACRQCVQDLGEDIHYAQGDSVDLGRGVIKRINVSDFRK